jgi:hypothetical protein
LTADHGGAENVNYLKDHKYNVNSISPKDIRNNLKDFSIETLGLDLVLNYSSFNLFNKEIIKSKGLIWLKLKRHLKDF